MKNNKNLDECGCGCNDCDGNNEKESNHYKVKLKKIIDNSYLIYQMIEQFDDLPSWIQDKITIAEHNMEAIISYIEEDLEMNYSYEQVLSNNNLKNNIDLSSLNMLHEAEYRGRKVKLGKPFRTPGGPKKFSVYVKNKSGNVVKVNFGDPNLKVKNADPKRAKSFRARHKCDQKKDRTTPGYWSCNVARYKKALGLTSSRTW